VTPAQTKRFLPENYSRVVEYIRHDMDGVCSDSWKTLQQVADHMGWQPRMVSGVLGILTHQGYLRRQGRKWHVVKADEAA
jgi:hypothetical protein